MVTRRPVWPAVLAGRIASNISLPVIKVTTETGFGKEKFPAVARPAPRSAAQEVDVHDPAMARPGFGPQRHDLAGDVGQAAMGQTLLRHAEIGTPPDLALRQ